MENKIHVWNHQPDIVSNYHHSRNRDIFSKQMQQQRP